MSDKVKEQESIDVSKVLENLEQRKNKNEVLETIDNPKFDENLDDSDCIMKDTKIPIVEKDPRQYTLNKLVDLFHHSETKDKSEDRKKLLEFTMIFIAVIFAFAIIVILLQGLNIIKLEQGYFIGLISSILATITFILRTISKYLFNNDSDKILKTIEKIVESYKDK